MNRLGKTSGWSVRLGLVLLVVVAAALFAQRSSSVPSTVPPSGAQSNLGRIHFAIADWDGDRKPDFAFVEAERPEAGSNRYSIRLRFGAGTESAFGVNAPRGGLRLVAKDVNGDDKVDLVVTSNFEARVIEILLNDGHGQFSVAAPGAYDAAAADPDFRFRVRVQTFAAQISIAPFRSTFEGEEIGSSADEVSLSTDSVALLETEVSCAGPRSVRQGRAPPSAVSFG